MVVKAKLDSPSGPKLRKKNISEPTMTLHTKAATDDIYEIFNAPLKPAGQDELSGDEDDYETDGDYTTDAESTGTTRQIDQTEHEHEDEDVKSVSEWSDFSTRRHVPDVGALEDLDNDKSEPNDTQVSDLIDTGLPEESSVENVTSERLQPFQDNPETPDDSPLMARTSFVPVPPEDWEPPTRPYRDPAEVANNRLPFMTPITERTEVSLEMGTERREQFKTPCKRDESHVLLEDDEEEGSDLEPMSSPLQDITSPQQSAQKASLPLQPKLAVALSKASSKTSIPPKGPFIKDVQCNPVDEQVRKEILANIQPPLSAYQGFYDHRQEQYERGGEIRKFAKALHRSGKNGGDRTSVPAPALIELPDVACTYTVKRELGAGAYAPVYLVHNSAPGEAENNENAAGSSSNGALPVSHRHQVEALKMEAPPNPWEFYMMRLAHNRLGPHDRASASLSYPHEMHLYQDEAFLFLPFHPHGTLLDVVNFFRAEASGTMEESLAMFFTIELMRTVEALHGKNLLHGDIKPDNCLLRLDNLLGEHHHEHQNPHHPLSSQWRADGSAGWSARGVTLIDFGRGIDMRAFVPDVQFIADWKTTAQDCAEMREGRPWTWQIDYHGLAGTIHCLLFGKYIETVRCDQGGLGQGGRKYRIRENLKRYWQTDLWSECFEILLNPSSFVDAELGRQMPLLRSMRSVREKMERWLEVNSERGVGLKSLIGKLEASAKARRH